MTVSGVRLTAAEREAEVWDAFWETDAARCCSCPSCNYYAPDYGAHKDESCLLRTLVERIIAARLAAVEALADEWGSLAITIYGNRSHTLARCAEDLRAALTPPAAAQQDDAVDGGLGL
jgi:hypothetical protein